MSKDDSYCIICGKTIISKQREEAEKEKLKIQEEKGHLLLLNKKLYDEETQSLLCPKCSACAVKYHIKVKDWICDRCGKSVDFGKSISHYNLDFTDKDKYNIYKIFGIEALKKLTGLTWGEVQNSVGSYFEKCCTSMGDNCLYYNHFEEIDVAKKIIFIDNLFEKSMLDCISIKTEIDKYFETIEDAKSILGVLEKGQFNNEYRYIQQKIETIIENIENHFIVVAKTELKKGKKVYIVISGDDLIADPDNEEGLECFCWTNAKKGEVVGVCELHSDSLNEVKQIFDGFKLGFENVVRKRASYHLSPFEENIISLISDNEGIFQSQLWKELQIDSRKCSRIIKSLVDKDLINRKRAVSNGAVTYRLSTNV